MTFPRAKVVFRTCIRRSRQRAILRLEPRNQRRFHAGSASDCGGVPRDTEAFYAITGTGVNAPMLWTSHSHHSGVSPTCLVFVKQAALHWNIGGMRYLQPNIWKIISVRDRMFHEII